MEARKRGVDHLRAFARNVQQNEAPISLELVNTKGVLREQSPWAMSKLVEVRVRRDEEKLLVDEFFISLDEVTVARGRFAVTRGFH